MPARPRAALGVCGLLLLVSIDRPAAQTPPPADDPADMQVNPTIPTLNVGLTVYGRDPAVTPRSVTVIDRRVIEDSGARTVGDLLRYAAGVHVLGSGPRGGFNTTGIRGGDPNFTVVLLDGVPLNDGTDTFGGSVNVALLPTAGIEKIEIVRGPMSFSYGSAALAGVVNIVTQRGEPGRRAARLEVEGGGASFRRGAVSWSGATAPVKHSVSAQWEAEEGRIEDDRFHQLNLTGALSTTLGDRAELILNGRAATSGVDDYPEASGGVTFGSGALRVSDSDEVALNTQLLVGETGSRQHKLAAALFHRRLDRDSPGVEPVVPPTAEATRYTRLRASGATDLYVGAGLRVVAGVDVDHEAGENESVLLLPAFLGGAIAGDYLVDRTTTGAYVEMAIRGTDALMEVGVRLDAVSDVNLQWSPRVGLSVRPRGGPTRLRGSLSRGFKLPSFFALASPPALGGNPLLQPEIAIGGDVGVEHRLEALRVTTEASLFYYRYDDLIDFNFDSFRLENRSKVASRGVELSVRWDASQGVSTQVDLTWNAVDDQDSHERLLHRPEWIGNLRFGWRPTSRLRTWLDAQLVSDQLDRQLPVPDRTTVAGHALLGAAASWRLAERWEIAGRIDNLTDRRYETLIGFPGAGVSGRIGLRYEIP